MKVRFVEIEGVRTRYYVAGSGPALLLIHGVGSSADSWARCIDLLGERSTVYAVDLIGHGFSDAVDFVGKPPQELQLKHLFGFVDALGLSRYAVAGASFGGLLAALMYFERPSQVDKLVLIGSGSVFNPADDQVEVLQAVLRNQIAAAEDPTPDTIRARNAGSTYQKADVFEEIVLTLLTSYALPDRARALRQTVEGLIATVNSKELRVLERLEQIAVPTLVVTGREDPRTDWKHVEAGHKRMPDCVMRIVEKCGHKPYSEHPREFSEAVLAFLV
jgi:2-hydroxy-6-oxonona-2,4-dienedioate hydrolase